MDIDRPEFDSRQYLGGNDSESENAWWAYLQRDHKLAKRDKEHFLFISPIFTHEFPAALSRRLFNLPEGELWQQLDRYLGKHSNNQLKVVMDCIINYAVTLHYREVHWRYVGNHTDYDLEQVRFEFVPAHKRIINAIYSWLQVRSWEATFKPGANDNLNKDDETRQMDFSPEPEQTHVKKEQQESVLARASAKPSFHSLCKPPFTPKQADDVLRSAGLIDADNNFLPLSKGKAGQPAAYRTMVTKQKMHDKTNSVWSRLFAERYNVTISSSIAKYNAGSPHVTGVFTEYCKTVEGIIEAMDTLDSVVGNFVSKKI